MKRSDLRQGDLGLTIKQSKVVELASSIIETPPDKPFFQHAILCQVGLPRDRQLGRRFERSSGEAALVVTAGELWNGQEMVEQPLPFGTKPRLALVKITTEAVRTRSRQIDVGRSTRDFMRQIGIDTNGRNYGQFRQQLAALAACTIRLGFGSSTVTTSPVEKFSFWRPEQQTVIGRADVEPGMVELSQSFYDSLLEHAVPLDPRALSALQNSALQLDVYTWLAHRLYRISRLSGERVSWAALQAQFGQEFGLLANFKRAMLDALRNVLAVYPQARIEPYAGGLTMLPSPAPVPVRQIVVRTA